MGNSRFDKALQGALARWNEAEGKNTERQSGDGGFMPEETLEMSPMLEARVQAYIAQQKDGKKPLSVKEVHGMKKAVRWRKMAVAGLIAAALVICTACAYVASPEVREFINLMFLRQDSVKRLDTVPEGWIGIYTVEDLEGIRENLGGRYILMNDLRIPDAMYEPGGLYENGFSPIGPGSLYNYGWTQDSNGETVPSSLDDSFTGAFNGNGYVISNVHIRVTEPTRFVGLFGFCYLDSGEQYDNKKDILESGIVKNLGVTDSSIQIETVPGMWGMRVGMIAGESRYVAGCFTENVTISYYQKGLSTDETDGPVMIGGVAGTAAFVDSCWSNADIQVSSPWDSYVDKISAAGVCGSATTCVTSYFNGTVKTLDSLSRTIMPYYGVVYIKPYTMPLVLNEGLMGEILSRSLLYNGFDKEKLQSMSLAEICNESTWDQNKLTTRYGRFTLSEKDELFKSGWASEFLQTCLTYDISASISDDTSTVIYMVFRHIETFNEDLQPLFQRLFTPEEFTEICRKHGVKYGSYDNYDLRFMTDCSFEGFDFQNIWVMNEENLPVLRLFQESAG